MDPSNNPPQEQPTQEPVVAQDNPAPATVNENAPEAQPTESVVTETATVENAAPAEPPVVPESPIVEPQASASEGSTPAAVTPPASSSASKRNPISLIILAVLSIVLIAVAVFLFLG